jgi:para-aminobenzoate synthetase component 1
MPRMPHRTANRPLDWPASLSPLEAMRRWPAVRALVALHSGRLHERWSRWTILASPRGWLTSREGATVVQGIVPRVPLMHDPARDVIAAIDAVAPRRVAESQGEHAPPAVPFAGGWIAALSYDLGRWWEPAARAAGKSDSHAVARDDRGWPLADLAWCPDALVHDGRAGAWHAVGDGRDLIDAIESNDCANESDADDDDAAAFRATPLRAEATCEAYERMVARGLEFIAAGDVFQVNLARRFTASFEGSTRALWRALVASGRPWYGAYLETPDGRCVASVSPELFLEVDAAGRVVTRPIKGTRAMAHADTPDFLPLLTAPSGCGAEADALRRSGKDAAELHMIVDLMRNDLGRVCEIGSIRVDRARDIEAHPTVHHGVAQVSGRLRTDVSIGGLLRASFPAGSVTGAPKIRAMQIIDELEPVRRGLYCGSIGFVDHHGRAAFNVAIRTATLRGRRVNERFDTLDAATLDYSAGAGIVAESVPALEAEECMAKTEVVRHVIAPTERRVTPPCEATACAAPRRRSGRSAPPRTSGARG